MSKQNPLIKIEVSGGVASYQILRGKVNVEFIDHDDCETTLLEGDDIRACPGCREEWSKRESATFNEIVEVQGRGKRKQ